MGFITDIWNVIFYHPVVNLLLFLYKEFGNLGVAIIILTIIIRIILIPFAYSQFKSAKKIQSLKPKLKELKKLYGHDKQKHREEIMKLYKEHGVNPTGSLFSLIVQLPIIIALYTSTRILAASHNASIFNNIAYFNFLKFSSHVKFNINFLGMDLSKYAAFFHFNDNRIYGYIVVAVLVVLTQYFSTKLSLAQNKAIEEEKETLNKDSSSKKKNSKNKSGKPAKVESAMDMDEFAESFNNQMLYLMPIVTGLISLGYLGSVPIAVSIYWIVQSIFVIIQIIITDKLENLKVKL